MRSSEPARTARTYWASRAGRCRHRRDAPAPCGNRSPGDSPDAPGAQSAQNRTCDQVRPLATPAIWREHLDRREDDVADLLDPAEAFAAFRRWADLLAAWHEGGRSGSRPPGRVSRHSSRDSTAVQRLWATPLYLMVYDPDGRPWRDRVRFSRVGAAGVSMAVGLAGRLGSETEGDGRAEWDTAGLRWTVLDG